MINTFPPQRPLDSDTNKKPTSATASPISQFPKQKPETIVKVDDILLKDKFGDHKKKPSNATTANRLTPSISEFKNVDIVISGTTHRINAPINLIDTLNQTAEKLNDSLKQMRKNVRGRSPTNEELLVLHCLELYDIIADLEKSLAAAAVTDRTIGTALDKVIQNIRAIGQ